MGADSESWVILCLSHLEWTQALFQRPQQVMSRLSRDRPVFYAYPLALREWLGALRRGEAAPSRLEIQPGLTLLRPRALLPAFQGRLPLFQWINDRLFRLAVRHAVRHVPRERLILWYYYPRHIELIDALRPRAVAYECMDNFQALYAGKDDPVRQAAFRALQADEPRLLRRADAIFYGAQTLMDERPEYAAKSTHIPTGVDLDHFARAANGEPPAADIGTIRGPILGYWGAIDNRIDFDLLTQAARACPEWSFVFVGPFVVIEPKDIDSFLKLPNVHWLGPKPYAALPDYARAFDICLMPFKVGDEGRYLNPTKTLEYFATGKPVLSTRVPDVERFYRDLVAIADTPAAFIDAARRLLRDDSESARAARIAKASAHSWDAMAARLWSQVRARLGTPP